MRFNVLKKITNEETFILQMKLFISNFASVKPIEI